MGGRRIADFNLLSQVRRRSVLPWSLLRQFDSARSVDGHHRVDDHVPSTAELGEGAPRTRIHGDDGVAEFGDKNVDIGDPMWADWHEWDRQENPLRGRLRIFALLESVNQRYPGVLRLAQPLGDVSSVDPQLKIRVEISRESFFSPSAAPIKPSKPPRSPLGADIVLSPSPRRVVGDACPQRSPERLVFKWAVIDMRHVSRLNEGRVSLEDK